MSTQTLVPAITQNVVGVLLADGWAPRWAACQNSITDEYGNVATIHADEYGDTVRVDFEYAMPGVVETMHFDPNHGAARIARVISTLADAPTQ